MTSWSVAIAVLAITALAGCAAPEPLPAKSAAIPAGIDLSGQWQLRVDASDSRRQIREAERRVAGTEERLIPKSGKSTTRRKSDKIQVHVFLETGNSLKLTQTEHGLFVSFDRAVVEEYRFGEQRMANVGPVAAERVSGWENGAYVIETRDKEGAMLIESYQLDGDDMMTRTIQIVHEDDTVLDVQQTFDRR